MVSKASLRPKSPKISVIMPAYNAEKYIAEAIGSVLSQTFKDFELIIIDDASRDRTWEIIKKYSRKEKRILALHNKKNLKLSKTLNIGINKSSGAYIARMDADDLCEPDRLEKQYRFMEHHKNVGILGGSMSVMKEDKTIIGKRTYPLDDLSIRKNIFWYSPFSHPLVMLRRSVIEKVGGYDHKFNPAEDYELYFRIGKISKFSNLPDTLLRYRIVEKSMTTGSTKNMELQTIKIRHLYAHSKGYNMSYMQKIYNALQLLSINLVSSRFKIWLFNLLRNSKTSNHVINL
jgi:glycosyltransferase involved in cell wall biosynthesis